jgi:hypothetical protein
MQLGHTNMWCSYLIIILFYIEYYFLLTSISPFSSNLLLTFIIFYSYHYCFKCTNKDPI